MLNLSSLSLTNRTRIGTLGLVSSRGNASGNAVRSAPFRVGADEAELSLRVLVDRSIVEAFAGGGRAVASTREYPGEDETSVRLWSDRSSVMLSRVEVWSMGCGWEDDRAVDDQEWPVTPVHVADVGLVGDVAGDP